MNGLLFVGVLWAGVFGLLMERAGVVEKNFGWVSGAADATRG